MTQSLGEELIFNVNTWRVNSPFGSTFGTLVLTSSRLAFRNPISMHKFVISLDDIADISFWKGSVLWVMGRGWTDKIKITLKSGKSHKLHMGQDAYDSLVRAVAEFDPNRSVSDEEPWQLAA